MRGLPGDGRGPAAEAPCHAAQPWASSLPVRPAPGHPEAPGRRRQQQQHPAALPPGRQPQRQVTAHAATKTRSSLEMQPARRQQGGQAGEKFAFRTDDGMRILASVEKKGKAFLVSITVEEHRAAAGEVAIVWGTYRSSAVKWFNPEELTPPGSTPGRIGKGLRSQLQRGSGGHEIQFRVPEKLAPVLLGFQLELRNRAGQPVHRGPVGSEHFAVPIGWSKGDPLAYGATLVGTSPDGASASVNFAVVSRNAKEVSLCLARRGADGAARGFMEVALDPLVNRKGDVWHARVDGLKDLATLCWGWRADADISWDMSNRFHPGQVMLDPYAAMATPVRLAEGLNVPPPTKGFAADSAPGGNPPALMGALAALLQPPQPHAPRPQLFLEDLMVMELDVPSFRGGQQNGSQNAGKYLGVLDAVPAMRELGVNAVMLSPVTVGGAGLGPFGRAPFSFFAPEPRFASGSEPEAAASELRTLIQQLHNQDMEVYLQVEYSLTGEGWDDDASAVSLRGLDAAVYYRAKGVLNVGHANVQALILDSLRHWSRVYNVDGFCFVNAETLALDRDGNVLDSPPLADAIANDAELRELKLIAWSADDSLLPRGGARGFPHWATWMERNTRFTTDVRTFFNGTSPPAGAASNIATRICGSADLFAPKWGDGLPGGLATGRRAAFGLNSSYSLDTQPIDRAWELLPHGHAAGQEVTMRQTLLFTAILSQGTPLIGADVLDDPALFDFTRQLWELRQQLRQYLSPVNFDPERDIRWYGADPGRQPDWDGSQSFSGVPGAAYLAFSVHEPDGSAVYVAYNPYDGHVPAILPPPPLGAQWRRAVDTSDPFRPAPPEKEWLTLSAPDYTLSGKAALLLVGKPLPRQASSAARPPPANPAAAQAAAAAMRRSLEAARKLRGQQPPPYGQ